MLRVLLSLLCLGLAVPLHAQSPAIPSDRLGWDQAVTAGELPLLSWVAVIDGGPRVPLTPTCSQPAPDRAECQAPLPAMTPGTHTLEVIAIRTEGGLIAESPKSAPFSLRIVIVTAPTNVRIIR